MSEPRQLELEPTIAMDRGDASVWQCAWCGSLVYNTRSSSKPAGECPACLWNCAPGAAEWWRQDVPVGPFRESA